MWTVCIYIIISYIGTIASIHFLNVKGRSFATNLTRGFSYKYYFNNWVKLEHNRPIMNKVKWMGFKESIGLRLCKLALWQRSLKHRSVLKLSTLLFELLLSRRVWCYREKYLVIQKIAKLYQIYNHYSNRLVRLLEKLFSLFVGWFFKLYLSRLYYSWLL